MRFVDGSQMRPQRKAQHDGVHQTSRPGHNRRPAAAAAQDRHTGRTASRLVRFDGQLRTAADYDQRSARLPEPQTFLRAIARFSLFQQCIIEGQILCGGRERLIQKQHAKSFP